MEKGKLAEWGKMVKVTIADIREIEKGYRIEIEEEPGRFYTAKRGGSGLFDKIYEDFCDGKEVVLNFDHENEQFGGFTRTVSEK